MIIRFSTLAAALAVALTLATGCGSSDSNATASSAEEQIEAVLAEAAEAIQARDGKKLCTLFAERVRDTSSWSNLPCPKALGAQIAQTTYDPDPEIVSIKFHGKQANIKARQTIHSHGGGHGGGQGANHGESTVLSYADFVQEDGAWKIQAWFRPVDTGSR